MCFKIGYAIGWCFMEVLRLLWAGTVKASMKNKPLLITYVCLGVATLISYVATGNFSIMLSIFFILALLMGIIERASEKPIKERRKYFNAIFKEINLKTGDEQTPYYLYEKDISEYATLFAFNTVIPLNEWQSKKDKLEMYLNAKVVNIRQDEKNNRIMNLVIQTDVLPDHVDWNDGYIDKIKNRLTIGIGYYGVVGMDLEKHPHCFIAGETGSGKSNILKCFIYQALVKKYEVVLIDFKRGVSFSSFSDCVTIYYEYIETMKVLEEMVKETKRRLDLFRECRVDNLKDYNKISNQSLRRKIIFIDELTELLKIRDKEISNILYDCIETLTRLSRSVGIHLIMGIQRPDSTIVNGQIKNNVSFRVCGRFVDKEPSRIMLGSDTASNLANVKGRFIVKDNNCEEIQSFYYTDNPSYPINETIQEDIIYSNNEIHLDSTPSNEEVQENEITEETSSKLDFDFSDINKN